MENFLYEYIKDILIVEVDDGYNLYLPFMLFNDETTITLYVKKNKMGYYDIDDKGRIFKYLDNLDVNIQDYTYKIDVICRLFS